MVKKWIKKAIKHPGELRKWASARGLLTERGTIDLQAAKAYCGHCGRKYTKGGACRCSGHMVRAINLAQTLRGLRGRRMEA